MNITMIESSNAMNAFLPRALAPVSARYQGSALLLVAGAPEPSGWLKRRTTADPCTHRIRTPMI